MNTIKRRFALFSSSSSIFVEPYKESKFFSHLISLTGKSDPLVLYIGAARGDDPKRIEEYYRLFSESGCRLRHLNMTYLDTRIIEDEITYFDLIYVDGGSTKNLVALFNLWKIDEALRRAYNSGSIIAGASAGAICWFEHCVTDSIPKELTVMECLGWLKGTAVPHSDSRPERIKVAEQALASETASFPCYLLEDGACVIFENEEVKSVVSIDSGKTVRIIRTNVESIIESLEINNIL